MPCQDLSDGEHLRSAPTTEPDRVAMRFTVSILAAQEAFATREDRENGSTLDRSSPVVRGLELEPSGVRSVSAARGIRMTADDFHLHYREHPARVVIRVSGDGVFFDAATCDSERLAEVLARVVARLHGHPDLIRQAAGCGRAPLHLVREAEPQS